MGFLDGLRGKKETPVQIGKPFKMRVANVLKVTGLGVVAFGVMEKGCVRVGDRVTIQPSMKIAAVSHIKVERKKAEEANTGDRTEMGLKGIEKSNVRSGSIITR